MNTWLMLWLLFGTITFSQSCKTLLNRVDENRLICKSQSDRLRRLQNSEGTFLKSDDGSQLQIEALEGKPAELTSGGCLDVKNSGTSVVIHKERKEIALVSAADDSDIRMQPWTAPFLRLDCGSDNVLLLNKSTGIAVLSDRNVFPMLKTHLEISSIAETERLSIAASGDTEKKNPRFELNLDDGEYLLNLKVLDPFGTEIPDIPSCLVKVSRKTPSVSVNRDNSDVIYWSKNEAIPFQTEAENTLFACIEGECSKGFFELKDLNWKEVGCRTLNFFVKDPFGNRSEMESSSICVDESPPQFRLSWGDERQNRVGHVETTPYANFEVNVNDVVDDLSAEQNLKLECRIKYIFRDLTEQYASGNGCGSSYCQGEASSWNSCGKHLKFALPASIRNRISRGRVQVDYRVTDQFGRHTVQTKELLFGVPSRWTRVVRGDLTRPLYLGNSRFVGLSGGKVVEIEGNQKKEIEIPAEFAPDRFVKMGDGYALLVLDRTNNKKVLIAWNGAAWNRLPQPVTEHMPGFQFWEGSSGRQWLYNYTQLIIWDPLTAKQVPWNDMECINTNPIKNVQEILDTGKNILIVGSQAWLHWSEDKGCVLTTFGRDDSAGGVRAFGDDQPEGDRKSVTLITSSRAVQLFEDGEQENIDLSEFPPWVRANLRKMRIQRGPAGQTLAFLDNEFFVKNKGGLFHWTAGNIVDGYDKSAVSSEDVAVESSRGFSTDLRVVWDSGKVYLIAPTFLYEQDVKPVNWSRIFDDTTAFARRGSHLYFAVKGMGYWNWSESGIQITHATFNGIVLDFEAQHFVADRAVWSIASFQSPTGKRYVLLDEQNRVDTRLDSFFQNLKVLNYDPKISSFFVDSEGGFWISMMGRGTYRIRGDKVEEVLNGTYCTFQVREIAVGQFELAYSECPGPAEAVKFAVWDGESFTTLTYPDVYELLTFLWMQNDLYALVRFKKNEDRSLAKLSNGRWEKISTSVNPYVVFGDENYKLWIIDHSHIEILNGDIREILPYNSWGPGTSTNPGPNTKTQVIDRQIFMNGCGKNSVPCGLNRYDPLINSAWN